MSATTLPAPTVEVLGPFERHTLPSGAEVFYRDGDHSYWSGAKPNPKGPGGWSGSGRLTGVSSVVAPFDWRPDNLMRWAANLNLVGVAALAAEGLSVDDVEDMRASLRWLESAEAIDSALGHARLRYDQARDDAAARGTNVHKHALHALATGSPVPRLEELTDEERGYARGVIAFWHECEPDTEYAEQVVCDPALGVAGRFDLIGTLTLNGFRQRVLLDAKTSGFLPVKHHVQLAGYRHCAQVSGLVESLDCEVILQVTPDGRYELVPSTAVPEDFTTAVEIYRRAARIQRDCNAGRKAAAA